MSKPRAGSAHAAPGDPGARSRPESRTIVRRIAAALTAVALGAGLALVGVAAPASAHHNTITAVAACDADSSTFDITWTVENSEAKVEKVLTSSDPDVVPVGTEIGKNKSEKFVEYGVEAGTYELTLKTEWSNGTQNTDTGRLTISAANCGDGTVKKITFCHATGSASNPYVRLTTSVSAFFHAGHIDHQDKRDIYPSFSYVKKGETINVAAQGDQSLLQYEDCTKPFDSNWQYAAPTCEALVVVYPAGLPAGQANDVNVRVVVEGKDLTLNFHNNSGTWSGTKTFTFAEHPKWPNPDQWSIRWIQVAGTNYHWEGQIDCGVAPQPVKVCHWNTDGTYDRAFMSVADFLIGHSLHSKDIHSAFSYWFFGTKNVPAQGDQSLLQYEDCVKPPTQLSLPAKPAFVDECGVADDRILTPSAVTGVEWNVTPVSGGSATATATAQPGYVFVGGETSHTWTFAFTDVPCVTTVPVPAEPQKTDECGVDADAIVPPVAVQGVEWVLSPVTDGAATATATTKPGYIFADGTTRHDWILAFTDVKCPPTTIALNGTPTRVDVCGTDDDRIDVPASTDLITWKIEGDHASGAAKAIATAADGYTFEGGSVREFPFTFDLTPCPKLIEVPAAPDHIDRCGVEDDAVTLPAETENVVWTIEGDPTSGAATAVATAKPGFVFDKDLTEKRFSYEFTDADCIEPSLDGSLATGICLADAPWIFFDVTLIDPDKQSTGRDVKLVMSDGTNSHTIELGTLSDKGTLEGKVLWPGASVADDGVTPTGWPGWEKIGDAWVETDGNFAWTRALTGATLEVNPTLAVDVTYPPATPDCATGPNANTTTAAAGGGTGLASTGFAGTTIAIVAGIIVIAGIAFLVIARIRRKRA